MKKTNTSYPKLTHDNYVIDSHCHLDMNVYHTDFSEVLSRAQQHGVRSVMTIGIDIASSKRAVELAQTHQQIYATIGVHPHDVNNLNDDDYNNLRSLYSAHSEHIAGYGEIGLDYVKMHSPAEKQRFHFKKQLELSTELKLPIVVHNREADSDTLEILKNHERLVNGGVMHCFSGDYEFAKAIIDLGMFISIPGIVTFKNASRLHRVVKDIPLENMLIETDGPFLSPHPYRGKRNEPANVLFTAEAIARIKEISIDKVANQTSLNTQKLFNLP